MPHARRGADLNAEADGINHAEPDCALSTVSTELTKERKKSTKKNKENAATTTFHPKI